MNFFFLVWPSPPTGLGCYMAQRYNIQHTAEDAGLTDVENTKATKVPKALTSALEKLGGKEENGW